MRRLVSSGICGVMLMILAACTPFKPEQVQIKATPDPKLSAAVRAVILRYKADEFMAMTNNLRSDANAVKAYYEAAELGDATSQVEIAKRHETGTGLDFNRELAALWYARASRLDNPIAQRSLAVMHINGKAVIKNDDRAAELFRQSAEQDDAAAQYYLGRMYYRGRGVPKDIDIAISWVRKSAEQGYSVAKLNLGKMIRKKNRLYKTENSELSKSSVCLTFGVSAKILTNSAEGCGIN